MKYICNNQRFLQCIILAGILSAAIFILCKNSQKNDARIEPITTFATALPVIQNCDSQTLILFDIDDVLINPSEPLAQAYGPSLWFKIKAVWHYPQLLYQACREQFYSRLWQQSQWYVIEPDIVGIINNLKKRGCTVLALSSMETGQFGVIPNFPAWRYELLKNVGLEFSRTFENAAFKNLPAYRHNYPELYKGIVCCNQQPKGAVVGAFLDYFELKPATIIFFDDSAKNLQSVAQECKKRDIAFKGYEYMRAKYEPIAWDEQKGLTQLDYLLH